MTYLRIRKANLPTFFTTACSGNDVIELITVKYVAPDGVEKEENEGPGIWRCRNHYVELKRATPADVKPEGWKKKTRSGRTVKEYRGDVKWCGEQGKRR